MISSLHIKRKRNCRDSYFSKMDCEYPLRMQRTGDKNVMKSMNKDWYKKGWTMDIQNMSWVDYTGKPSSDNDIQLMVYSVRS